jgi:hypothetical protein
MIDAELDSLTKRSRNYMQPIVPAIDPQLATLRHRYMCLLISANIDKSVHLILTEYARRHGSTQLKQYVSKKYARGTNYNASRLIDALSLFDPEWGHLLDAALTSSDLKEKLDSIYGVRNSVAHGEQPNLSRPSLDGYFEAHERIIGLIREIVLGRGR